MNVQPPDQLEPASLAWAKTHLSKFGDTDIFPVPFEFDALWADWTTVSARLGSHDLTRLPQRPAYSRLVPKPRGGFRVALQLDPLDSILYTAMAYEAADLVEKSRIPAADRVACSYRLAPQPSGELFAANSDGWKDFHDRSLELATSGQYKHVVTADISDFYNQIYHHRLQNALAAAQVSDDRSKNFESFLGRLTAKQSRGIPVGPSGSILLAEACLNDVDLRLRGDGFQHTRYVDDFRVFCHDEREAVRALHFLTKYLFTAHRLSLQAHKTRIADVETFAKQELVAPEQREEKSRLKHQKALILEAMLAARYGDVAFDEAQVLAESELKIASSALKSVFDIATKGPTLNLGLARYALRRASTLRSRELVRPVATQLRLLCPVFREAILYFDRVWNDDTKSVVAGVLPEFLNRDPFGWLPFVRDWSFWIIEKRDVLAQDAALDLFEDSTAEFPLRHRAMLARRYRQIDWVRGHKESWMNTSPWEQRAILWAGSILARDERRAWLEPVTHHDDLVVAAIAKHVRSMS